MLRGRPALASVLLCFICLPALTPDAAAKICSPDSIRQVKTLISIPNLKLLDCKLYTPTIKDFQQNCPSSTLKCFAEEVKVLIVELKSFTRLQRLGLYTTLSKLAGRYNQSESGCLQCECHKEEKVEKFLQDLLRTLELINNECES